MRRFIGIGVITLSLAFAGTAMADAGAGGKIFQAKCQMCHGAGGAGTAMAPAFKGNAFIKDSPRADIANTIKNGRSGAAKKYKKFAIPMPPQKGNLSEGDINNVIDYLKSIAG